MKRNLPLFTSVLRRYGLLALAASLLVFMAVGPQPASSAQADTLQVIKVVLAEASLDGGNLQIVQLSLYNPTEKAITTGLRMTLLGEDLKPVGQSQRQSLTIDSLHDGRAFFRFNAPPTPGTYTVRMEVLSADYRRPLLLAGQVLLTTFQVNSTPEYEALLAQRREENREITAPEGLSFEKPDLVLENLYISTREVLTGETLNVAANVINTGGDIAKDIVVQLSYVNTRLPSRTNPSGETTIAALAPGESTQVSFDYTFDINAMLGQYRFSVQIDPLTRLVETTRDNNRLTMDPPLRVSKIRMLFPEDEFAFDQAGIFLFRWDSSVYQEFKVQIGVDPNFENEENFFDIPQGTKWTRDMEVAPLPGELPGMALSLMQKSGSPLVYWRVVGRTLDGEQLGFSTIRSFSIGQGP